jgi:hypothetical protein
MVSSCGNISTENAITVGGRVMRNKEHVLTIYPEAYSFNTSNAPLPEIWKIYVTEIKKNGTRIHTYLGYGNTAAKAWMKASSNIHKEMLRRLEA